MGMPKSPCNRDCKRRKVGCHNVEYCPEWGKYQNAPAEYKEFMSKQQDRVFYDYVCQRSETRRKYRDHRKRETT